MAPADVCKVPTPAGPVPTPMPNIGMFNQADGSTCSQKVKFSNKAVLTVKSEIPMSSGDEAGSAGGVVSGKIKGEITFKLGSFCVKCEGNPVIYLGAMAMHNGKSANTVGNVLLSAEMQIMVAP